MIMIYMCEQEYANSKLDLMKFYNKMLIIISDIKNESEYYTTFLKSYIKKYRKLNR